MAWIFTSQINLQGRYADVIRNRGFIKQITGSCNLVSTQFEVLELGSLWVSLIGKTKAKVGKKGRDGKSQSLRAAQGGTSVLGCVRDAAVCRTLVHSHFHGSPSISRRRMLRSFTSRTCALVNTWPTYVLQNQLKLKINPRNGTASKARPYRKGVYLFANYTLATCLTLLYPVWFIQTIYPTRRQK